MRSTQNPRLKTAALLLVLALVMIPVAAFPGTMTSQAGPDIRNYGTLDVIGPDGRRHGSITIEIAETPEEKATGLMWRTRLDDTVGMLFVYDDAGDRTFWMRNTPTSLDILFVSENREIIHIERSTEPMSDTTYHSKGPAKYVLEVMSGYCDRHHIKTGMIIDFFRKGSPRK